MSWPAALLFGVSVFAACASLQASTVTSHDVKLVVIPSVAPPGAETLGVEWRSVQAPGVGTILMAVAGPAGQGPFPAVVVLHGSHGFGREYVQLAKELSQAGVVAVAACWFAPGSGPGIRFISPLACPAETPPASPPLSQRAAETVDAVMRTVRTLPGVKPHQIALFGHSRGGGAAWNYVLQGGQARAVILNSSGYPDVLIEQAAKFNAPVLILHGQRDGPQDGGSAMTAVSRVQAFQAALRSAGRPVEAVIYKGGRHNDLFANPSQQADEVQRMRSFLRQQFRD